MVAMLHAYPDSYTVKNLSDATWLTVALHIMMKHNDWVTQ